MAMTTQELMRLAGWGGAASTALLVAVLAAMSGSQQQRSLAQIQDQVLAQRNAQAAQVQALTAQLTRLAATEEETGRLTELLRGLAADRERLMTRLSALERSLEDVVTGSIQKPAPAPAAETPAAAPEPPAIAAQAAAPVPSEPPLPARQPLPKRPQVAAAPATAAPPAPDPEAAPRPPAGVDIGGAANFDGLRALWHTLNLNYVDLFTDLHPIVVVRENSKSRSAELRLVAGPLNDVESASRICATLAAAKRACRLAVYEGQPLSLTAPEPPRRPSPVTPRPPARP